MSYSSRPRPTGHSIQPYRDARGYSITEMVKRFPRWRRAGFIRVLRHGFYNEQTVKSFEVWAKAVRAEGMDTGAVYGMGQWTEDHPEETGQRYGEVFAHPLCSIGGLDAEGAYDRIEGGPGMVRRLGERIRKVAPSAYIFDQPWPILNLHSGFPIAEFDEFVDEHCPQMYDADFKSQFGKNAAPRLQAWSKKAWKGRDTRPMNITLQGYHHDDNIFDMVEAYHAYPNSVTWTDWEPWESTLMAVEAAEWIRGFASRREEDVTKILLEVSKVDDYRPMTRGRAAVGVFQREKGLKADFKCGFDTMAKMGIRRELKIVKALKALL